MLTDPTIKPYLHLQCGLGEAPFYEEFTHTLRFVDIVKEKLHKVDLEQGPSSHIVIDLEASVRSVALPPSVSLSYFLLMCQKV